MASRGSLPLVGADKMAVKAPWTPAELRAPAWFEQGLDHGWRFFSSVRVALVLILLLTAATLAGTLLAQAPGDILPGTPAYTAWLQRFRPRYGLWTDPLSTLQLFSIFGSWWFRGLIAALAANIVVCSVNRWPGIAQAIFSPRVQVAERFFQTAPLRASLSATAEPALMAQLLSRFLALHHYRALTEEADGVVHLYADKHRFARLGTYGTHLSLLLVLAGALAGGVFGFTDKQFVVPEGATREVGFNTGLTVTAVSFVDEYYPEGPPKDYRSELIVSENGVPVKQQTIRVNEPMEYKGVRFYQSFFGPAAYLQVTEAAGRVVFNDGVALAWRVQGDRPAGSFSLPERNLTVFVVGPSAGTRDQLIRAGEVQLEVYQGSSSTPLAMERVAQGQTKELSGLRFTFVRERQFTGLQVSQAPATPVIWIASTLLVLGLAVTFYFPHRRLWAVMRPLPAGGATLEVAAAVRRDPMFSQEFARLAAELRAVVDALWGERETVDALSSERDTVEALSGEREVVHV